VDEMFLVMTIVDTWQWILSVHLYIYIYIFIYLFISDISDVGHVAWMG
jgi:hypothetical protein